jgi:hypothetical protein
MRPTSSGPLDSRTFKVKNPSMQFFCPLCRTPRAFSIHYRLQVKHYISIVLCTSMFAIFFWNLMEWRSLLSLFFFWAAHELGIRLLYKKEIPCPHCGFDASWYKKDVLVARQKVKDFWDQPKSPEDSETPTPVPPPAPAPEPTPEYLVND